MNFLAPFFLLGALAVIGPIVFHLIRRTTREVTPFSSLMFLAPTPPRVTRRSRLENVWLLILRCLVLALLALGFARPFLPTPSASPITAGAGKRIAILVDTSASMKRETLFAEARAKVEEILRRAAPADEIALIAFDRTARTLVSFDEWKKLAPAERAATAVQHLAVLTPTWNATHLDTALMHAAELLAFFRDDSPAQREIVVISDLQEGAHLDALQGFAWPKNLTVTLAPIRAAHLENAGLSWVSEADEAEPPGEDAPLRLRVTNAAESKREQFAVSWTGTTAKVDAYVPAGQSRIVRAPKAPPGAAPSLTLSGDDTDFDNTVHILTPQPQQVLLLFAGSDAEDDPRGSLYYLKRAFQKTRRQNVEILARPGDKPLPAWELPQAQLLILGDGAGDAAIASARQFARDGKIVVIPLTTPASAQTVEQLLEVPKFTAPEAAVKDYALLAQLDFQHPLFAPFADPRYSDFTKIHFWKYRRLDLAQFSNARILARFDSGDPALVQVPLARGSVVIFTSSWRPLDSQLALSSKFVPLLHALLEQSSNLPTQHAQYFIGDEVPLPAGPQPFTIRKPEGSEAAAPAGSRFTATNQPGIYAVTPGTLRFVVNLAPEESRTSPLPPERFTALGVPLGKPAEPSAQLAQREARAQAAEIESRQKLWRWLIVAALGVVLLETLIAGKLSRAPAAQT